MLFQSDCHLKMITIIRNQNALMKIIAYIYAGILNVITHKILIYGEQQC